MMQVKKFNNWRWWVCLPVLIAGFIVLYSLFIIGELLVVVGGFIQSPYHSDAPKWLKKMEVFIHGRNTN